MLSSSHKTVGIYFLEIMVGLGKADGLIWRKPDLRPYLSRSWGRYGVDGCREDSRAGGKRESYREVNKGLTEVSVLNKTQK